MTEAYFPEQNVIAKNSNSVVLEEGTDRVRKIIGYSASSAREISFNEILKDVPFILHPLETEYYEDEIHIIYPKTEELLGSKILYEEIFIQAIKLLTILENLNIVHLDFRFENIGVVNGKIVLRDFGNACLLTGKVGYLPHYRYPVEKVRAPEFIELPESDTRGLVSYMALRKLLNDGTVYANIKFENEVLDGENRQTILHNLYGSEFDTRADLWSFACWFYYYLFGHWYRSGDDLEELDKYDDIGFYIKSILNSNYNNRLYAGQIAEEFQIKNTTFHLSLSECIFNYNSLQNSSIDDIITHISKEPLLDIGEVLSNYLWLLLLTQRMSKRDGGDGNVLTLIHLFSKVGDWSQKEIDKFIILGNIYTDSVLTNCSEKKKGFQMIINPPRTGEWNNTDQLNYLIEE